MHNSDEDEFLSDSGSEFGLDYNAINYLTGDIVEALDGKDGSPLMDFKPNPAPRKQAQAGGAKLKTNPKIKNVIQDERDFFGIVMV
jgi:hypothetical protein